MFRSSHVLAAALPFLGLYAWALARTRPFTFGADALAVVGFAIMAVPAALSWRRWARAHPTSMRTRRAVTWAAAIAALAAVELSCYFSGFFFSRQKFPTLSSLYSSVSGSVGAKVVFVLVWLAIGWGLFRPRGPASEEPRAR